MKTSISRAWTADDRLAAVAALLPMIQDDIYAGCYSEVGHPNITTLQHIIYETPECLNQHNTLKSIERMLAKAPEYPKDSIGKILNDTEGSK